MRRLWRSAALQPVRRLTLRHLSWLHFKAAVATWAILLLTFTPVQVSAALGVLTVAVALVTIAGCVVAASGLVMSAQHGKVALIGLSIEYVGLWFTAAGPVSYLITQVYLAAVLPDGNQRYALAALAYVFCAALLCRILIVGPRRAKEAHDPRKGA